MNLRPEDYELTEKGQELFDDRDLVVTNRSDRLRRTVQAMACIAETF